MRGVEGTASLERVERGDRAGRNRMNVGLEWNSKSLQGLYVSLSQTYLPSQ